MVERPGRRPRPRGRRPTPWLGRAAVIGAVGLALLAGCCPAVDPTALRPTSATGVVAHQAASATRVALVGGGEAVVRPPIDARIGDRVYLQGDRDAAGLVAWRSASVVVAAAGGG